MEGHVVDSCHLRDGRPRAGGDDDLIGGQPPPMDLDDLRADEARLTLQDRDVLGRFVAVLDRLRL
jgi:hypothetical protein